MSNSESHTIAIIGGFWKLPEQSQADAQKMGVEIGASLAQAGMRLVVYYSDTKSLEPYVVEGYVGALRQGQGEKAITIRVCNSQRGEVKFEQEKAREEAFERSVSPGTDPETPFYRSLAETKGVDGVVLMAGGMSTLIAGQIVVARRLPVAAVDVFDGSAAKIRNELTFIHQNYPSFDSAKKVVEWLKQECDKRAEALATQENLEKDARAAREEMERKLQAISDQGRKFPWAVGAFIILLLLMYFGLGQAPTSNSFTSLMIAALVASGASGALIRSIIWGANEAAPRISLLLGSVAGLIVGIGYLIPQLVAQSGSTADQVKVAGALGTIQFLSAVVVGFVAGLGSDTIFARMLKEAANLNVTPPGRA